jgi:hypothetical protein
MSGLRTPPVNAKKMHSDLLLICYSVRLRRCDGVEVIGSQDKPPENVDRELPPAILFSRVSQDRVGTASIDTLSQTLEEFEIGLPFMYSQDSSQQGYCEATVHQCCTTGKHSKILFPDPYLDENLQFWPVVIAKPLYH